ncbi:hypothetical protein [Bacillus xiapuensis]|uniref:hypothetical protein n=1 Tax=Bacillus xiapuensis TaxID=2014075 RepID=UPI000C232D8C|nr:hypothetical protein [Bacillus xiapuensis]
MNVQVLFSNQLLYHLPYRSLAAFQLLCRQLGYRTSWKPAKKELHLDSGLKDKMVILETMNKDHQINADLITKTSFFLMDSGIQMTADPAGTPDLKIQFNCTSSPASAEPRLDIIHNLAASALELEASVIKEMNQLSMDFHITRKLDEPNAVPELQIKGVFPDYTASAEWENAVEHLAICLSSSILDFFLKELRLHCLSLLPLPSIFSEPPRTTADASPAILTKHAEQPPAEETLLADLFFDYTVFPFEDDKTVLTVGHLHIKNIGNTDLYNPIICIKVDPPDKVKFRGQILPPDLTEGMGLQTTDGEAKGWRYLEDDWFKQAKERGEYWITPIEPTRISPGDSQILRNFQLEMKKTEEAEQIIVQGFVLFREQHVQFQSNNQIVFSL